MLYEPTKIPSVTDANPGLSGAAYGSYAKIEAGVSYTERRMLTGATVIEAGAFYGQYVEPTSGDTFLQGGTVSGGTGNKTKDDIKIIDSGTGDPVHAAGQHMYIEATGNGVTADGVLLPGWNLSTATIGYGATVPDNTLPTASSANSKKCYVDLGVFTADAFLPAQAGNVQISFCPGSYTVSR